MEDSAAEVHIVMQTGCNRGSGRAVGGQRLGSERGSHCRVQAAFCARGKLEVTLKEHRGGRNQGHYLRLSPSRTLGDGEEALGASLISELVVAKFSA